MDIKLNIPESVVRGLRVPEAEIEDRLRTELAIAVYAQQLLTFGKASELANLSRVLFADLVTQRSIPRHYGPEELAEDLAYAKVHIDTAEPTEPLVQNISGSALQWLVENAVEDKLPSDLSEQHDHYL